MGLQLQSFARQQQILHGQFCFYGGAVATVGPPGPVGGLGASWPCQWHGNTAAGICTNNCLFLIRGDGHETKGAKKSAPERDDGRARELEAYLCLLGAIPRE